MKEVTMESIMETSMYLIVIFIMVLLFWFLISPNMFVKDISELFKAWKDEWKEFLERFRK